LKRRNFVTLLKSNNSIEELLGKRKHVMETMSRDWIEEEGSKGPGSESFQNNAQTIVIGLQSVQPKLINPDERIGHLESNSTIKRGQELNWRNFVMEEREENQSSITNHLKKIQE
jgi:hypothetical protein